MSRMKETIHPRHPDWGKRRVNGGCAVDGIVAIERGIEFPSQRQVGSERLYPGIGLPGSQQSLAAQL
ncbi:MAG: hypothetical protein JWQ49_6638 [Edaphobacter sp.]|nr:hypothetical protein [Edaphobacter sp.]